MKALKDFDYDLWTTDDNLCMVRVKATGEECEVSRETFRLLRAEEKRLRRERIPEKKDVGRYPLPPERAVQPLSLQTICSSEDEDGEFWLIDPEDFVDVVMVSQLLEQFRQQLTIRQLDILEKCLLGGMSLTEYARAENLNYSTVWDVREAIVAMSL